MDREEIKRAANLSWGFDSQPAPEAEPGPGVRLQPVWPDERLEAEMMRDADWVANHGGGSHPFGAARDVMNHVKALLARVRDLERALKATGYFWGGNALPAAATDPG